MTNDDDTKALGIVLAVNIILFILSVLVLTDTIPEETIGVPLAAVTGLVTFITGFALFFEWIRDDDKIIK